VAASSGSEIRADGGVLAVVNEVRDVVDAVVDAITADAADVGGGTVTELGVLRASVLT